MGDPCVTPRGVRLCGGNCAPEVACGQFGCRPFVADGAEAKVGVCMADLPPPISTCWRCADGEVCADIAGEGLICVEEALCRSLMDFGLASACTYADFSPYDGRPLAIARGADCPKGACGPGCGSCGVSTACSGRSADHGYGFCLPALLQEWCYADDVPTTCSQYCAAWTTNTQVSKDYGWCAIDVECDRLEPTGRIECHRIE